jgi:hypothetical protein
MKLYNLARMTVSGTPGTGNITLLAAATGGYLTFAQAQVPDGAKISYGIKDGTSLEVGRATYNSAGPSLSNRAPLLVTGGGQTPLSLTSAAIVGIVALAEDFEEAVPLLSQILGTNNSTAAEVEATRALRANIRAIGMDPPFLVGHYSVGSIAERVLGAATGLAGNLEWQAGMPMSPGLALINKVQVMAATTAISGARNGNMRMDLRQYDTISAWSSGQMVQGFNPTNSMRPSGGD